MIETFADSSRKVVVVDGCRTPFCRSGTAFTDLRSYDLGRMAVSGLLHRTRIDPAAVDLLVMGLAGHNGPAGWILGSVTEQVLDAIECSVLAVKPSSFVSPIQLEKGAKDVADNDADDQTDKHSGIASS